MMDNKDSKIYDEDLSLFPNIEQFKRQLQQLRELTPDSIPFEKLYDKYFDLGVILPHMISMQTAENFNKLKFFRVRLNINENAEDTRIVQTHSFPPGNVCKENGRANLKGKSVFYCSNDPLCALFESKPKIGDIAHISIWNGLSNRVPNPANEQINIKLISNVYELATLSVFDGKGELVLDAQLQLQTGINSFRINTSKLNAGLYFVSINSNQTHENTKFIKQ